MSYKTGHACLFVMDGDNRAHKYLVRIPHHVRAVYDRKKKKAVVRVFGWEEDVLKALKSHKKVTWFNLLFTNSPYATHEGSIIDLGASSFNLRVCDGKLKVKGGVVEYITRSFKNCVMKGNFGQRRNYGPVPVYDKVYPQILPGFVPVVDHAVCVTDLFLNTVEDLGLMVKGVYDYKAREGQVLFLKFSMMSIFSPIGLVQAEVVSDYAGLIDWHDAMSKVVLDKKLGVTGVKDEMV